MIALLLTCAAWLSVGHAQESSLELAYQKEFAYLQAEQKALEGRLAEIQAERDNVLDVWNARLIQAQNALLASTKNADDLATTLEELVAASENAVSSKERVEAILEQANVDADDDFAASARALFQKGARRIAQGRQLTSQAGSFFLEDGSQTQGTVIHVGPIASYGVSDNSAGLLVPTGGGELRRVTGGEDAARALAGGLVPDRIESYVYASRATRAEEARSKTPLEVVQAGGTIAWVIVILGGVAAVLVFARIARLVGFARADQGLLERLETPLREHRFGDVSGAIANVDGPTARVVRAVVDHRDHDQLEPIASEALMREVPRLQRFQTAILVIAAVSPLLGLLGTVTGMIGTFEVITLYGTGDPKLLSGGISEALITTELGLIAAIPALLIGNMLRAWSDRIEGELERAAIYVITHIEHARSSGQAAPTTRAANA